MATSNPKQAQLEVVDPRWLLKALGLTIASAALLSYLSLCLLIYQGSWQFFLHPSPKIDATPSVAYQPLRFDAATTGTPRLSGWWIPAGSPTQRTILFLHDGSGSLSSAVPTLDLLHNAGVNIFAFDYRGFGQSDGPHPNEARMAEDAAAALVYLVDTRHIPKQQIVAYGEGLGAPLAAHLANSQTLPAMILANPDPDAFLRAVSGKKSVLLPMKLLVRERFDLQTGLLDQKTAKLLLANDKDERIGAIQAVYRAAAGARMTVTFGSNSNVPYVQAITRFLDEYVPAGPSPLR
jgi:pimeloyl-ACP methyl ester carboxylesterase